MRVGRATAVAALWVLSTWPAVVGAHGTEAGAQGQASTVPFAAAIGVSTVLSVTIGLGAAWYYRSRLAADSGHGSGPRVEVTVLLVVLGVVALLSAVTQQPAVAVAGAALGGSIAWVDRTGGVSAHGGCADAAFGAILLHRTVEGVLVAGVYAASAAFGLIGLALLTGHAVGETVAIAGLYAAVGRGWVIASVVAIHLGFLVGSLTGYYVTGLLSAPVETIVLAGVGAVLLVAGATEVASARRRRRLEVSPNPRSEP